ncbi:hypothetical protein P5V15_012749 [Pogonomyrmex californicus]
MPTLLVYLKNCSHTTDCEKINNCAIRLLSEDDKWLEFKNHTNKERLPFNVYANLECVLPANGTSREGRRVVHLPAARGI